MTKDDIQQIRIDVELDGQSVLSMMFARDGTIGRSGNGRLPPRGVAVMGRTDGSEFRQLVDHLDERIFAEQGIYDHPDKRGMPLRTSVVFLGNEPDFRSFEFRVGLENDDIGNLLAYLNGIIQRAMALTEEMYQKAQAGVPQQQTQQAPQAQRKAPPPTPEKRPWWRFW